MKTLLKSLVIALCCLLCCSPFSIFAEGITPFILTNDITFSDSNLSFINSNYSSWQSDSSVSVVLASSTATIIASDITLFNTSRIEGDFMEYRNGSLYATYNNDYYDLSTFNYLILVNKFNSISLNDPCVNNPSFVGCVVPTPIPTPPASISCPVALNDVLANDYITSLLTWLYRANVEQFIIYRLQQTFDVSGLLNTIDVSNVGEFKGYIVTTPSNVVQTFVYEYNRPTVMSADNGNTWTYQYMDILDPDYVSDWEMVLHWTCLDTRYESQYDATEQVNNSIQTTIQQNATIISQQSSMISNQQQTNNLISEGTSVSQSVSNSILDTNSSLNAAVNQYDQAEKAFTEDFKTNVDAIETNFSWGTHFLNSANFVRTTFNELVEPAPIYNMVLFSLILGFALFIIGRLR